MHVPISKAKLHWHELVRRAEAGEEIIPTHFGRAVVQLKPIRPETGSSTTQSG
jgi:antitoxin (DNA-binding transcriptional repressor) of toxin-antitoxin stability system